MSPFDRLRVTMASDLRMTWLPVCHEAGIDRSVYHGCEGAHRTVEAWAAGDINRHALRLFAVQRPHAVERLRGVVRAHEGVAAGSRLMHFEDHRAAWRGVVALIAFD